MSERARRVLEECLSIAAMSEEPGRITRRFLTEPMHRVHAHLRKQMEDLGMQVRVDAAGNLRGWWPAEASNGDRLIIGSHLDTVPNAGAYDGILGVVIGLEWVRLAQAMRRDCPVEVVGFSEEEGVRYGVPFLGSRAMTGCFDSGLLGLVDANGITVEEAIRQFGLRPSQIVQAEMDGGVRGFVEVHIEQGPVLDAEGLQVAAVEAIVGQTRGSLEFTGQANHAGTTPMHLRRDAMAAAAEWITEAESLAQRTPGLVATVGRVSVAPNAGNVIAGSVAASLDCRHADDSVRRAAVDQLTKRAEEIAIRRGLSVRWTEHMNQPAVPMDLRLTAMMADAIRDAGFQVRRMTSGAGHDAMIMAPRVPATMLFLRSPGGISHHPDEAVLLEDIEASLLVAEQFLKRLASSVR
ncbi:allantoate amidohydrolase [Acidobacteria bacterium AB60]|nr:allantoate amidohydrolase [Acidobacteria bacterium AB60]